MKILTAFALLLILSFPALAGTQITNFFEHQPIRANNGEIEVTVSSTSKFTLYLDDKKVKTVRPHSEFSTVVLENVDRGVHTLRVVSKEETHEVTIHVLRTRI